jgi:hypothetical protein
MEDADILKVVLGESESLETNFRPGDGRKRLTRTFGSKDDSIRFCGLKAFGE